MNILRRKLFSYFQSLSKDSKGFYRTATRMHAGNPRFFNTSATLCRGVLKRLVKKIVIICTGWLFICVYNIIVRGNVACLRLQYVSHVLIFVQSTDIYSCLSVYVICVYMRHYMTFYRKGLLYIYCGPSSRQCPCHDGSFRMLSLDPDFIAIKSSTEPVVCCDAESIALFVTYAEK